MHLRRDVNTPPQPPHRVTMFADRAAGAARAAPRRDSTGRRAAAAAPPEHAATWPERSAAVEKRAPQNTHEPTRDGARRICASAFFCRARREKSPAAPAAPFVTMHALWTIRVLPGNAVSRCFMQKFEFERV